MSTRPILSRLLEALILAGLAGGIGYALTTWLAPPSVSATLVAAIVGGISALATLAPTAILRATSQLVERRSATPETYYDFNFDLTKEEGSKN